MSQQPILIDGQWREANATSTFAAENPQSCAPLEATYPVSSWQDCDQALDAAFHAAAELRELPGHRVASFLEGFADRIEQHADAIVEMAHTETALAKSPRLAEVELPRTTRQLRLAAAAARDGSWAMPTIDTETNIRSQFAAIGPVAVFGPNNFPLAFNSASGGDFAAAVAAGNPVIAKANSSHPGTTHLLAEQAHAAVLQAELPAATVQLLYRLDHRDGERLVADPRLGATGYTGSRSAGLQLKAAADAAGRPIYLELSSINPVVILPGALSEDLEGIVEQFATSCLMGTGQFCTNPGLVLLLRGEDSERFISAVAERFAAAPAGTLLSKGVRESLKRSLTALRHAGAECVTGDTPDAGTGYSHANTVLRVSGQQFLEQPAALQEEAFGNSSLLVVADDLPQATEVLQSLEGNLTGCIYSATTGQDDDVYDQLAPHLQQRVGRLLNDKMPTGVAVSAAMNHGGPFPATGHPGFTAVGIPAALRRFAMLQCFDDVRPHRLPASLRDKNPEGRTWRSIDGRWTQDDV